MYCGEPVHETIAEAKRRFEKGFGVPLVCGHCIWERLTAPDFGASSPHPEDETQRQSEGGST